MASEYVGKAFPPLEVDVEKWQLRFFAKAVGETNPIYFDEGAARVAGHRSILAPPTYAVTLSIAEPDPFQKYRDMGINPEQMLHAQQKFEYFAPIYAGDHLTFTSRIVDFIERRRGAVKFLIEETDAVNQEGVMTTRFRKTVVIKGNGLSAETRRDQGDETADIKSLEKQASEVGGAGR